MIHAHLGRQNHTMKFLFDFFPVLVFFIVYKVTDNIYHATAVLIAATIFQVGYTWFKQRRVERVHLVTLIFVVLLGGLTLLFQDDTFIMWKPTIVNWLFAAILLGSAFIGEKNLLQRMLESNLQLPSPVWRNLNYAWILFFIASGVLNLYVAYSFSQEFWVNFKLFGLLGLTFLFVLLQGIYLSRFLQDEPDKPVADRDQQ